MTLAPAASDSLEQWLDYIATVNPREIELGLERSARVWQALGGGRPAPLVFTVAGTNGKGSCVAALDALLRAQGKRTGCYTSPHIKQFNERIRINGEMAGDSAIRDALAAVERARGETLLSYFEFTTLAALLLFVQADLDAVVLEVGLGGRLDAVNIIDPDVAVITSISLDHVDWLGPTREAIGREKAGIARAGAPLVCADPDPPVSILDYARSLHAQLTLLGADFNYQQSADATRWTFSGHTDTGAAITVADIPASALHPANLSAALQALLSAGLTIDDCAPVLGALQVPGRFEWRLADHNRRVLLDVAHNPAAAQWLASRLETLRRQQPVPPRIAVVLAVMADKDIENMTAALQTVVDFWYIAQVDEARCMPAEEVTQRVSRHVNGPVEQFQRLDAAFAAALAATDNDDVVVITGSFYTVAALRDLTRAVSPTDDGKSGLTGQSSYSQQDQAS